MSQAEKQQELLLRLQIENQQLLKFKKLNSLMHDTLESFVLTENTKSPFAVLFDMLAQELNASISALVALNDDETSYSIIATSHTLLNALPAQTLQKHSDTADQHIFSQSTIFFNLALSEKWPDALRQAFPNAASALVQPIRIGQHRYAIVMLSEQINGFNNDAKAIIASYTSFIASLLSLFENQRLAAERDQLFAKQKRIEQNMVSQEKLAAIGQLAAGVAHELNNPLGFIYSNLNTFHDYLRTIKHFIDLAYEEAPKLKVLAKASNLDFVLEDTGALIDESLDGARRSRDIIHNLRTFSHPDETSVSEIDILALIKNTLRIVTIQIKNAAVITLQEPAKQVFIKGNETQLSQVFINLINNACQAIDHSNGKIEIVIEATEKWVNISVKDNGSGISQAHMSHIFEPFFTTKDVGKGTGLGLSISRAIIEQHQGCLALENSDSNGTTFVMCLPVIELPKHANTTK